MDNTKNQSLEKYTCTKSVSYSVLVLSIVVALLIGLIIGFFSGESRVEERYSEIMLNQSSQQPQDNQPIQNNDDTINEQQTQQFPDIDYSAIVINEENGTTVENYYYDEESRYYASQLIGKTVPEMTWKTSDGQVHSTKDYDGKNYIFEVFSPTCGYCNASIPIVDAFRESSDVPIVSLTTQSGDLTNFNQNGENAFLLESGSSEVDTIMANIPWVPTFVYVENGIIKLVTFGGIQTGDIENAMEIAY